MADYRNLRYLFLTLRNMEKMTQDWFEMTDLKKRYFDKMVWIPLFQSMDIKKGAFGYVDYLEEYFAFRTIAVPISQKS